MASVILHFERIIITYPYYSVKLAVPQISKEHRSHPKHKTTTALVDPPKWAFLNSGDS
jgi:hypothetical protein